LNARGYTLPQLLGVVALLGILMAVAAPTLTEVRVRNQEQSLHTSLRAVEQAAQAAAANPDSGATRSMVAHLAAATATVELPAAELEDGTARPLLIDLNADDLLQVSMGRYGQCATLTVDDDADQGTIATVDCDDLQPLDQATAPPSAPAVTASGPTDGQVTLTWDHSGGTLYEVRYAPEPDDGDPDDWVEHTVLTASAVTAASVDGDGTVVAIDGLRDGGDYLVQVAAVSFDADGSRNTATVDTQTYGATAMFVTDELTLAADGEGPAGIVLAWDAAAVNDDIDHYRIKRDDVTVAGQVDATTWTDVDVAADDSYSYQVFGITLDGREVTSNPAGASWEPGELAAATTTPLPAPTGLAVESAVESTDGYTLEWDYPSDLPVDRFEIQRRLDDGTVDTTWTAGSDARDLDDNGATVGVAYRYRIRAVATDGSTRTDSSWSGNVDAFTTTSFDVAGGDNAALSLSNFGSDGFDGPYARLGDDPDVDGPSSRHGAPVNNDAEVTVNLDSVDPAPDRLRVRLSGTPVPYPGSSDGDWPVPASGTFIFRLVDIPDGTYRIAVEAVDTTGTVTKQAGETAQFTIDTAPPPLPGNLKVDYDMESSTFDAEIATIRWTLGPAYDLTGDDVRFEFRRQFHDEDADAGPRTDASWEVLDDLADPSGLELPQPGVLDAGSATGCWEIRTVDNGSPDIVDDDGEPADLNHSDWHHIGCTALILISDPPGPLDTPVQANVTGNGSATAPGQFTVTWGASDLAYDGYEVQRRRTAPSGGTLGTWTTVAGDGDSLSRTTTGGSPYTVRPHSGHTYVDNDVYRGETWEYRVRGWNALGEGPFSSGSDGLEQMRQARTRTLTHYETISYSYRQRQRRDLTTSIGRDRHWADGGARMGGGGTCWSNGISTGWSSSWSCGCPWFWHSALRDATWCNASCRTQYYNVFHAGQWRCDWDTWRTMSYGTESWGSWYNVSSCRSSSTVDCRSVTRTSSYQSPVYSSWSSWTYVSWPSNSCSTSTTRECRWVATTRP